MLKTSDIFKWINEARNKFSNEGYNKSAIARWCIQQFVTCPYCRYEFDVIQANLKRKTNQGTMTVTQKRVTKFDKDKFEYDEITTQIPCPPYFGVMLEDCNNLDEHIDCMKCNKTILIKEATWGFGK